MVKKGQDAGEMSVCRACVVSRRREEVRCAHDWAAGRFDDSMGWCEDEDEDEGDDEEDNDDDGECDDDDDDLYALS